MQIGGNWLQNPPLSGGGLSLYIIFQYAVSSVYNTNNMLDVTGPLQMLFEVVDGFSHLDIIKQLCFVEI